MILILNTHENLVLIARGWLVLILKKSFCLASGCGHHLNVHILPCVHLMSEEAQQRCERTWKIHQINRFEMCNFFFLEKTGRSKPKILKKYIQCLEVKEDEWGGEVALAGGGVRRTRSRKRMKLLLIFLFFLILFDEVFIFGTVDRNDGKLKNFDSKNM